MTPTVDLDQLAALRALRRGLGDDQVQVLDVVELVDHQPGRDPAPVPTGGCQVAIPEKEECAMAEAAVHGQYAHELRQPTSAAARWFSRAIVTNGLQSSMARAEVDSA
jgi:hypothetical protein